MALIVKLNAISPVINLSNFAINICMFSVIAISFISNIILLYSYVYVLGFKRAFNFYLFVEKLLHTVEYAKRDNERVNVFSRGNNF